MGRGRGSGHRVGEGGQLGDVCRVRLGMRTMLAAAAVAAAWQGGQWVHAQQGGRLGAGWVPAAAAWLTLASATAQVRRLCACLMALSTRAGAV
jgi:hypothetical protein